jgi:hypothetical protein
VGNYLFAIEKDKGGFYKAGGLIVDPVLSEVSKMAFNEEQKLGRILRITGTI